MSTFNKKRVRISSPVSDSDGENQGNPKTHENGNNGDDCRAKGLKNNTCYVCDGKDDWVLLCHGDECPIAIHQSCMSDEPDFDEFGNFYCPYCWYKCVFVKYMKLRKKVMVIEKSRKGRETLGGVDLSLMMDEVRGDIDNEVEDNVSGGRRTTSVGPSGNRRECDDSYEKFMAMEKIQRMKEVAAGTDSQEVSQSGDADVDEQRQQRGRFSETNVETAVGCNSDVDEGRKSRAQCSENTHQKLQGRDSDDGEERKQQSRCDINHETVQAHSLDVDLSTRKQRGYSEKNLQENGFRKDERIDRNSLCSVSSPIATDNVNNSISASRELALIIHPKAGVQERPLEAQPYCTLPPNKSSFLPEKCGYKSYLEKNGTASNDPGQRRFVVCSDKKRKRILWTQAEEEMLKVGVQKFPGIRNIPWRKILKYGRDVFHDERVPSDLKDKWKNMNKMSSDTGKWVSLSTERQPNYFVSEACSDSE